MIDNPVAVWTATLAELELQMTRATFDSWLRDTRVSEASNGVLVVEVRNQYGVEWLEGRLRPVIERTLNHVAGQQIEIEFVVADVADVPANEPEPAAPVVDAVREAQISALAAALQQIQDPEARAVLSQQILALGGTLPGEQPARWTPIDVDTSGRWFPVPEYANRFWAPLLGRVAFRVWMLVRQHDTRPAKVKAQDEWTPPRRFTAPELAREVPCGRLSITGVWRRCAPEHPDAVLRRPQRAVGPDDGPDEGWYRRRSGALELLQLEGLALVESEGRRRHKTYTIRVRLVPPVLSPAQVEQLDEGLQVQHDRWLEGAGVDVETWRQ